jgi:hypothetical protein
LPQSYGNHERWRGDCLRSNATAPPARAASDRVDLDVAWLVPPDLGAVDALARLQLAARRRGCWLQLHSADGGLTELLEFVGLGDVVHLCRCCGSPARRDEQAEPGS